MSDQKETHAVKSDDCGDKMKHVYADGVDCSRSENINVENFTDNEENISANVSEDPLNLNKSCDSVVAEISAELKSKTDIESEKIISPNKSNGGSRKHRTRPCKKRKWKPYMKLTWNERRRLEERDSRRACRIREEMSAHGLTLAPYNTTQFLMEDHDLQEPDYELKHKVSCNNLSESEEFYSSPDDEQVFMQQQFSETYDDFHNDYINGMSKYDLVCELMRLEDVVEHLERALSEARRERLRRPEGRVIEDLEKIEIFKVEIMNAKRDNDILESTNDRLCEQLNRKS